MTELPRIDRNLIGGQWLKPGAEDWFDVIQPSTQATLGPLPLSDAGVVDQAVAAARGAFPGFAATSKDDRVVLFDRLIDNYKHRYEEMATAISTEMGAPITVSRKQQAAVGLGLLKSFRGALSAYGFEGRIDGTLVRREPIGVAALITPWNWPMNQVVCKVGAALAAGCTMVLKPSIYAPYSAALFAEIVQASAMPDGVFNLVHGDVAAGQALARHRHVDMISFTGSTKVGAEVAADAAPTVKRVTQELGGKSPCIVLPGADVSASVGACVGALLVNSGQSCNAPTRLLVHADQYAEAVDAAAAAMAKARLGDPFDPKTTMGPLVNRRQFEKVRDYIAEGRREGARLVTGGECNPPGLPSGYYVEPTLFADVDNGMKIAREEIFGPVLCMIPFTDEEHAVALANDTAYGLTAYVFAADREAGVALAKRLRAGMVHVNGAHANVNAPFGGYKMSGNGRERGTWGIEEYLETKAIFT